MSNDDSAADGPGKLLAYAFFPTDGRIRFDPGETWMQRYDNNDANFRLVATHEIAYALGLEHSSDQSSIMAPYYKLMQPEALLPENDRHGIQALYGTNAPSADGYVIVHVSGGQKLLFAGTNDPAALMELTSIGLPTNQTAKISKEIMSLFEEKLNISADRMYLKFTNVTGNMMGWNKGTF
ncbi:unnamed protein product [Rotaria sp. Silwood1]|nr:unnamed protein product [Rotaria sp. Silwood1]CAF1601964.1 unnamed protein product [Rotaria sp. Silwood1]